MCHIYSLIKQLVNDSVMFFKRKLSHIFKEKTNWLYKVLLNTVPPCYRHGGNWQVCFHAVLSLIIFWYVA